MKHIVLIATFITLLIVLFGGSNAAGQNEGFLARSGRLNESKGFNERSFKMSNAIQRLRDVSKKSSRVEDEDYYIPSSLVGGAASSGQNEDYLARSGRLNDSEGLWNIYGENVILASRNIAENVLDTLGFHDTAAGIRAGTACDQDFDKKTITGNGFKGFMGWVMMGLGQVTPYVVGIVVIWWGYIFWRKRRLS